MADRIVVLGVSPDGRVASGDILASAALVVGDRRQVLAHGNGQPTLEVTEGLDSVLHRIDDEPGTVVVLADGDPGWFGITRSLAVRFGADALEVHPALSPVAATFAKAGIPWEDAVVVSAYGRDPRPAIATCLAHPKVAVLTEPSFGPAELARALLDAQCGPRRMIVAERLGDHDERLIRGDLEVFASETFNDPNVAVLLDPSRPVTGVPSTVAGNLSPDGWALPVTRFEYRDGKIMRPEVRAIALAHLGPRTGTIAWDVAAGSGSMSVELARFGAAVYAVERSEPQLSLVTFNASRHGVDVRAIHGEAPESLGSLPDPDLVFLGGGGKRLQGIVDEVARRARRRIAVAIPTVERVGATAESMRRVGWNVRVQMVGVADVLQTGSGHALTTSEPIFLVLGERR